MGDGPGSDTADQATQGEGAVARLAWVIVVALIALALWLCYVAVSPI